MKQSLQLKLGQHLTMTPQLQQAIRLLQLSTLELQAEIQEQLESNPLLELNETGPDGGNSSQASEAPAEEPFSAPASAESGEDGAEPAPMETSEAIPQELAVDTSWDEIYEPVLPAGPANGEDDGRDFEHYTASATTLGDHLRWQLNLTPMS